MQPIFDEVKDTNKRANNQILVPQIFFLVITGTVPPIIFSAKALVK